MIIVVVNRKTCIDAESCTNMSTVEAFTSKVDTCVKACYVESSICIVRLLFSMLIEKLIGLELYE